MYFASNIKLLRKRKGKTQDDVAYALEMKRSTLSGYENKICDPGIESLSAFSDYFKIAIDTLIRVNLSELSESQLLQLDRGSDIFLRGSNLRIIATTVDKDNADNIELVSEKAKAGYKNGFADPEFIRILPTFQLPFLSKQKKYRTFQISGDSMLPIPDKSYVTGEYTDDWNTLKNRHAYIILTIEDGVVFKVVENKIEKEGKISLYSLNDIYEPYDIDVKDIREIWKFVHYISPELPEPINTHTNLMAEIKALKKDMKAVQTRLDL
jgi:transcriptional regulator with XRE-family HTH domain